VTFSPDSLILAAGDDDGAINIWDTKTRRLRHTLKGHGVAVQHLSFFDDGRGLKSVTARIALGGIGAFRFGTKPVPEEPSTRVWDVRGGKPIGRVRSVPVFGYVDRVRQGPAPRAETEPPPGAVALSSDGGLLATVSLEGGHWTPGNATDFLVGAKTVFHLWDVEAGKSRVSHEHPLFRPGHPLRFSLDGRVLLTPEADCVCLLEVATLAARARLRVEGAADVAGAAISANGARLAVICRPRRETEASAVWLCDLATGRSCGKLAGTETATALALSPDGNRLACGHADGSVSIRDVTSQFASAAAIQAVKAREADDLWKDMGSSDAAVAFRAMVRLANVAIQAPELLRVRAARPVLDTARVRKLLDALDHDEFGTREQAVDELTDLGEDVRPVLEKALGDKPSPEVRRRLQRVLDKLGEPKPSPSQLRLARSVEVLERLGTAEARKVLEFLAASEQPAVAREAAAALQRLPEAK
jgi:hypothetical protein